MTASVSSIWTCWPAFTFTAVTTPSSGAATACSIFIASTTTTGSPLATTSPAAARTARTVPGMGERTVPSAPPAAPARAVTAGSVASAQVCPPRPSHVVFPSRAQANRTVRPAWESSRVPVPSVTDAATGSPSPIATSAVVSALPRTFTSAWPPGTRNRTLVQAPPPIRHPSPMSHGPVAGPAGTSRASAAAASTSSGGSPAGAVTRSASPVSSLPARTPGSARRTRRNAVLVVTPRTVVSARAASRRRTASSRSEPQAATLASIGS